MGSQKREGLAVKLWFHANLQKLTFDAVIPLDGHGWPHLLAAYYSVSCLDPLEALLHQGKRKSREILDCDALNVLRMQTIEKSLPDSLFLNVNTRDDYERLLARSES